MSRHCSLPTHCCDKKALLNKGVEPSSFFQIVKRISTATRHYTKNMRLQIDPSGETLLYLQQGQVMDVVVLANGKEIPLQAIHPGELFGFSAETHIMGSVDYYAQCDSSVMLVQKSQLLQSLSNHPQLLSNYFDYINGHLNSLLNKVILFTIQNNRQRIACYFLGEIQRQGHDHLTMNVSKTHLLECLGMSRSSFYRELNALIESGALLPVGHKQYKCNRCQLERILQQDETA